MPLLYLWLRHDLHTLAVSRLTSLGPMRLVPSLASGVFHSQLQIIVGRLLECTVKVIANWIYKEIKSVSCYDKDVGCRAINNIG